MPAFFICAKLRPMKLEFLAEGADDCPLLRLSDFDVTGAKRLREAFTSLANGSLQVLQLHEEWWIEPIEECRLTLRLGTKDLGVVQRLPMNFECALGAEAWLGMVEKTDPFCAPETGGDAHQWLNRDGEVSLLLSPSGKW